MAPKSETRDPRPELYRGGPTLDELLAGGMRCAAGVLDTTAKELVSLTVTIRPVPVSEYPALKAALLEESRLVEIYTGQAPGWGATVHPQSLETLLDEGRRMNAHFFAHWLPRRVELESQLQSGVMGEFMATAAREFAARMAGDSGATSSSAPVDGSAPSPKSGS